MRISNNIMAMNTHKSYTSNNNAVSKSAEKLSSGYRINRAGDDAAGLAISEKMRAQIRGLSMAKKNSQDAVSMVQTAEGALQEVHSMLQRMNELAVQAASDTNDTDIDRAALQQEFKNLQDEIDQISSTTKFNNMSLLDGLGGSKEAGGSDAAAGGTATIDATNNAVAPIATTTTNTTGVSSTISADTLKAALEAAGTKDASTATAFGAEASADGNSINITFNGETIASADVSGIDKTASEQTIDFGDAGVVKFTGDGTTDPTAAELAAAINDSVKNVSATFVANTGDTGDTGDTATGGGTATLTGTVGTPAAGNTVVAPSTTITADTLKAALEKVGTTSVDTDTAFSAEVDGTTINIKFGDDIIASADASGLDATASQVLTFDNDVGTVTVSGDTLDAVTAADVATMLNDAIKNVKGTFEAAEGGGGAAAGGGSTWVIQVGAEASHTLNLTINAMNTTSLSVGSDVKVDTRTNASAAITATRAAINTVSTQRAELGAMQNRLEYKINNLANTIENTSSAESRIRDIDIAEEMTTFTKNNILSQAATAMLAQANALPQNVLSLLR